LCAAIQPSPAVQHQPQVPGLVGAVVRPSVEQYGSGGAVGAVDERVGRMAVDLFAERHRASRLL
jgi:hypothetical protein